MKIFNRLTAAFRRQRRERRQRVMREESVTPSFDDGTSPLVPTADASVSELTDAEFAAALRSTGVHVGPPPAARPLRGRRKRRVENGALEFVSDAVDSAVLGRLFD